MTYGTSTRRNNYLNRGLAARNRKVAEKRASNAPVKTEQKRKYTPKVVKNTASIQTLARQVRDLQLSKLGSVQKTFESFVFNSDTYKLITTQPFVFALNDFTKQAPIWHGVPDNISSVGNTIPGTVVTATWQTRTFPFPSLDEYNYWSGAQDDECNPDSYLPISTLVHFKFKSNLNPFEKVWYRVDIIQAKKNMLYTKEKKLSLPDNVMGLGNLASNNMTQRNRINRQYFHILQTKWICVHNNSGLNGQRDVERHMKIPFQFKPQDHTTKLGAGQNHHTITGNTHTQFATNMPQDAIIWCVVSTSNESSSSNAALVQCTRFNKWRDPEGVAS